MMNTANKRASAIGIGLAIRLILPTADSTIDGSDRQQVAYSYAGIHANAPVIAPPEVFPVEVEFRTQVLASADIRRVVTGEAGVRSHVEASAELRRRVDMTAALRRQVDIEVER